MLISHSHRFIYLKTRKTAGTSVEVYFEKYCLPAGQTSDEHWREAYVGPSGIVGYRGVNPRGQTWFNHMNAVSVREKIPAEQWSSYFKFCVIRDPFDKQVSGFHMAEKNLTTRPLAKRIKAMIKKACGRGEPIDMIIGDTPTERFRSWIKQGGIVEDRGVYTIGEEFCVDHFIRFEKLNEGLREVCQRLDIPFHEDAIPRLKTNFRTVKIPLSEYYDEECVERVRRIYAREIDHFGYEAPRRVAARPVAR